MIIPKADLKEKNLVALVLKIEVFRDTTLQHVEKWVLLRYRSKGATTGPFFVIYSSTSRVCPSRLIDDQEMHNTSDRLKL
eukprot:5490654-Amphidinium_carterae.1